MTYIWFLDCGSASVTKVKLSKEREEELNRFLNDDCGDMYDWLSEHEDEFGISLSHSSWMMSQSDTIFEVDF